MRVLVVEDEHRIATDIAEAVNAGGFVAEVVDEGEDAWFRGGTESYAAIILDLGLPGLDGLTILKRWRKEGIATPVLVLTARGSWSERVDGIDAGADDYLPKPFRMEELMARLRALIRRAAGHAEPVISVGKVSLDPRTRQVTVGGIPVALTPLEFRLLNVLFHHRGRVVSQSELSDNLYSHDSERDSNAIEALVGRLRRKLKADVIETRRGFGYVVLNGEA
ncbi:MAG: response regulator transcription factor [Alphaproteobacteria bacterium]|nr:response regulator transcription factor [Alphaproteobacteria bacterium]